MAASASQPHATTPAQPDAPAIPGTNTRIPSGFQASVLIGLLLVKGVAVGLGLLSSNLFGYLDSGHRRTAAGTVGTDRHCQPADAAALPARDA
jgi:hypothetical protein